MKVAIQNTPVYSRDGKYIIGELERGERTLVLGEVDGDTVVAYVLGLVKKAHAEHLKNEDEWQEAIREIDQFLAWITAQLGCLYVWGAQGQKMTPALIKRRENTTRNYNRAMTHYNKHVECGQTLIAYDCSGLIMCYMQANNYIDHDTTANGLFFNYCTPIGKADLKAGDLVFKKYRTRNKMYHVGIYMGDGTVIHAKGRDDGVIRENIEKAGWNRFGRLKVFAQDEGDGGALYTRLLKRMGKLMRGDDVRAVQSELTNNGFDTKGVDGYYGRNTEGAVRAYQKANGLTADGIVGPKTWHALMG